MARLYGDENFPYPVVLALRRLGHDVLTAQEAGKAGQKYKRQWFWLTPLRTGGPY